MDTTSQQWIDSMALEGQPKPGTPAVLVDPSTVTQPRKNLTPNNEWARAFLTPPTTPDFVLPGLEAGEVAMLVSPGGTGKSWWSLLSAISMATGLDLLGLKALGAAPKLGKVRYISFEDTREVLARRMFAIGQAYSQMLNQKALDHLSNLLVTTTHYGRYDLLKLDLDGDSEGLDDHSQALLDALTGCRLAVIDTLSQSHSGDENNTAAMARLVGNLQHLARKTGAAILVLHHTSKGAALNGLGDDANAARGSSTLINNIRCGFFMAGMSEAEGDAYGMTKADRAKYVRWGTSKTNHIAAVNGVWFERKTGGCLVPVELVRKGATTKKTGGAL